MHNIVFKDKQFYKLMISLAVPIALQNLISSSLNMVDTLMIGRLGETQIASVGLANQFFFLYVLLLFGIYSGSGIFIAQFWGKKDVENIHRVLGICLITGITIGIFFTVLAVFTPKLVLSIFSKDINVIDIGSKYLRIVGLSYIINAISFGYAFALRSTGQPKIPMKISFIALLSNTFMNYLLIFGTFGFPKMGVEGAAIATLLSRIIELGLTLYIVYVRKNVIAAKLKDMMDLSKGFVVKFFKTTIPVILNEGLWALGMTMYTIAYSKIGTDAVAAVQISNTVQSVFFVITMGIGNACAVMIGNKIGAKEDEVAILYAKRFSIIAPLIGVIMGLALFGLAPLILNIFKVSPVTQVNSILILRVMSGVMVFKFFNIILVVGILRSGGDTKFSLFLETGSVWLVGVPLAFLGAVVLKLPVYYVVALVSLEELIKTIFGVPRIISRKWLRNVVENI